MEADVSRQNPFLRVGFTDGDKGAGTVDLGYELYPIFAWVCIFVVFFIDDYAEVRWGGRGNRGLCGRGGLAAVCQHFWGDRGCCQGGRR